MTTKVAVPQFENSVAPRFEAATSFAMVTIEGSEIISSVAVSSTGFDAFRRLRMLRIHRADALICNGIKASYLDMLSASGITVYPEISMPVKEAIKRLIDGNLKAVGEHLHESPEINARPHDEVVDSARTLFENNGYEVTVGPGRDAFLIDLVAEISCPVCSRPVRVAICCGAHTYRPAQEIAEFRRATSTGYNARVYVCSSQSSVVNCCHEYGIQPFDPDPDAQIESDQPDTMIPLLKGQIIDHERASVENTENK